MIAEIVTFIANTTAVLFNMLDSVQLESNISVLDVFCGFMFFDIIIWFYKKMITSKPSPT